MQNKMARDCMACLFVDMFNVSNRKTYLLVTLDKTIKRGLG